MNTTSTAAHAVKVTVYNNRGTRARRAVCSCGYLGVRFACATDPASTKRAAAKAQADADEHAAAHA